MFSLWWLWYVSEYKLLLLLQVQLHTQTEETIPVNESIITLLLKLHSQLSGRADSFSLEDPAPVSDEPIGEFPPAI